MAKEWILKVLCKIAIHSQHLEGERMNDRSHKVDVMIRPIKQKYKRNFVEVFEETNGYDERHYNDLDRLTMVFNPEA